MGTTQVRITLRHPSSPVWTGVRALQSNMQACQPTTLALRAARTSRLKSIQRRNLQDVAITRTGKPILRVTGGRSSLGGHTATVFGANGFLGRYIVNRLARRGNQVVVPYRDDMGKRHLKVTGDLGRVSFMEFDLRNTQSIEESVRHSDMVFNLIGKNYPTKNFSLFDVNVEGVERIAEACAKYDVDRFIHVSSYNADPNSPSEFFRAKAEGERVARQLFPETTIVRPAPCFGFEDNLLHRLAGETFELYGPTNYSMAEIAEIVDKEILKERRHINLPKWMLKPVLHYLNKVVWWQVLSADQMEQESLDQVIDRSAKTFKDLNIEPAELKDLTYQYLQDYRSSSFYDLPPATAREKQQAKKYLHVIDDQ